MPFESVPAEVFLEHNGVKIFHIYKDDDIANGGALDAWFSISPYGSYVDHRSRMFCVDDLPNPHERKTRRQIIIAAIDSGHWPAEEIEEHQGAYRGLVWSPGRWVAAEALLIEIPGKEADFLEQMSVNNGIELKEYAASLLERAIALEKEGKLP